MLMNARDFVTAFFNGVSFMVQRNFIDFKWSLGTDKRLCMEWSDVSQGVSEDQDIEIEAVAISIRQIPDGQCVELLGDEVSGTWRVERGDDGETFLVNEETAEVMSADLENCYVVPFVQRLGV